MLSDSFISATPPGSMTLVIDASTRCILEIFHLDHPFAKWHGQKITAIPLPSLQEGIDSFHIAASKLLSNGLSSGQEPPYPTILAYQVLFVLSGLFTTMRLIRENSMCPDAVDLEHFNPSAVHYEAALDKNGEPIIN